MKLDRVFFALGLVALSLLASAALACATRTSQGNPVSGPSTQDELVPRTGGTFVVSSYASTYPLQGQFEGSYVIAPASVVVIVRRGTIKNRIPVRFGDLAAVSDVQIAAGFGIPQDDGWRIDTLAAAITVVPVLAGEAEAPVGALRFTIPRRAGESLADRWLVFQVSAKQAGIANLPAGDRIANYVCAEENLLGPTPASRERAYNMKQHYSKTC